MDLKYFILIEVQVVKIEKYKIQKLSPTSGQQVGIYYAQQAFPNDTDWHHYTIVSDVTTFSF